MTKLNIVHKELYESGRWFKMSFPEKVGNIGSEISRANKWKLKDNKDQSKAAFYRSLELIDLTLMKENKLTSSELYELCRFRELWVDFFWYDNIYKSTAEFFQKYTDNFAMWHFNSKA
jgi:hypothetical protein